MAMRLAAKTLAGVAMCAALLTAGCQAVPEQQPAPNAELKSAPVPAAVPAAEVLQAVQAATRLRELPPGIANDQLLAASGDYTEQWSVPGCEPALEQSRLDDIEPCILGDTTSDRTMAVIGDSAAAMWHNAFDLIGKRNGWRAIVLTKSNCGPASLTYYQYQLERAYTECDAWQKWRMEVIHQEKAEVVVLAGWFDGGNQGPGTTTTPEIWREALAKTIGELPQGTQTFMLGGIPRPAEGPSECVAQNPTDLTRCATPATDALPTTAGWTDAAELTGANFIEVAPWFCAEVCPAVIADQLVYSGRYHVTPGYAGYLSGALEEAMAPALA